MKTKLDALEESLAEPHPMWSPSRHAGRQVGLVPMLDVAKFRSNARAKRKATLFYLNHPQRFALNRILFGFDLRVTKIHRYTKLNKFYAATMFLVHTDRNNNRGLKGLAWRHFQ